VTVNAGIATCSVAGGIFTATTGINLTASYSGVGSTTPPNAYIAGSYAASTSTFTASEVQDTTTTNLIVTPKKLHVGQPGTLTTIILNPPPGSGAITGEVQFTVTGGPKNNQLPLNCVGLTDNFATLTPTSGNEVTCNLAAIPGGANPLHVSITYFGDTNYLGSSITNKKIRLH